MREKQSVREEKLEGGRPGVCEKSRQSVREKKWRLWLCFTSTIFIATAATCQNYS